MKTYPLSQSQLGVYLEYIQYPESIQYNLPCHIRLSQNIDTTKLKDAIERVINTYPVFYTRVTTLDGELRQYPDYNLLVDVPVERIAEGDVEQRLNGFVRPFDLSKDALTRFLLIETPESLHLVYDIHHLILDRNNYKTLCYLIEKAYVGLPLPLEAMSLYDYAENEQQTFDTPQYAQATQYYKDKFHGIEMTRLSGKAIGGDLGKLRKISVLIPKSPIDDFCTKHEVKPSWLFMAAFEIVMSKFSRSEIVSYVTINHGRYDQRLADTVGMFVCTIPILMELKGTDCTLDRIRDHKQELASTRQNGVYPFTHFCQQTGIKPSITFGFQGSDVKEECYFLGEQTKIEQLLTSGLSAEKPSVIIYQTDTGYEIRLKYVDSQYEGVYMQRFAQSIANCVQDIIDSPDKLLKDVSIISETECRELIALGTGEELAYDRTETFVDLFRKQVALYPDSTAVVYEDRSYTYGEIDQLSTRLAMHLSKLGVCREKVVGVMIDRSEWMVIYPLAIMKAGGAYMPLDYNFPTGRLSYMVEDAGVSLILSETDRVVSSLPEFSGDVILTSDVLLLPHTDEKLEYRPAPEDMYVVLYTSGSTGQPKGCVLEHHNLLNFCYWYTKDFEVTSNDRSIAYANFGFDAHMMDIYPLLICGGSVYIIPSFMRMDITSINNYIEENRITIAFLTTQIGAQIVSMFDNRSLRLLSVGGEKLPPVKKPSYRFYNGYGPTECTLYSSFYEVKSDYDNEYIGRPLANYQLYVLDQELNLVPRGIAGELCVSGRGVARDYLNRPELTAEKFVMINGKRLYRTGDLVRWAENGNIQYLGRIDNQVKLRGFRIELGEIESAISKYAGIQSAVVEVKEIGGTQHLCGYYTSTEAIDEKHLREQLAESLTDYMVPTAFMRLEALPLTPNGKVNRKALPMPQIKAKEMVAPETTIEQSLFEIVAKSLNNNSFGVTTNLISMGLTSMGAIKLSLAVQRELGLNLPTKAILQYPVIRQWTGLIETAQEPIKVYEKREVYPLLELQQGIFSRWEQHQECVQYNIPMVLKLAGIDTELLYAALEKVLKAHPYLKVRLGISDGEVVQIRCDNAPTHILMERLAQEPESVFFQERVRPFNLLEDELYRIEIYISPQQTYLFMDFHHIAFDGGSLNILLTDLQKAYKGHEVLPELFTTYDFSIQCEEWKETEAYKETIAYFRHLTNGVTPALYPPMNSAVANEKAKNLITSIPRLAIKSACKELGVTENCFFITAFMQLLHRSTKEKHLLIETTANGRSATYLANTLGALIQGFPIVSHQENQTIADAMLMMQNQLFTTLQYEMYSNPELSEWYSCVRANIGFTYQGEIANEHFALNSASVEYIELRLSTTKVPIDLYVVPSEEIYELLFEYDSGLYSEADILRLGSELRTLMLSIAIADAQQDISLI